MKKKPSDRIYEIVQRNGGTIFRGETSAADSLWIAGIMEYLDEQAKDVGLKVASEANR